MPYYNFFGSNICKNDFKFRRDLSFLGRTQIAHHSVDGHNTNSEGMKKYAELNFSLIKIQFFQGGFLWHNLAVGIQGLGE